VRFSGVLRSNVSAEHGGTVPAADAQLNMGTSITVKTPGSSRSGQSLNKTQGEDVFASPVKSTGALKQMAGLLDALPQTHHQYDEHSSDIEKEFESLLRELADLLAATAKEEAARAKKCEEPEDEEGLILGLRWVEAGPEEASAGTEIKNQLLATALDTKLEFTLAEWKAFQVSKLSNDNFIKVNDVYFKPAGKGDGKTSEETEAEPEPRASPLKGDGLLENKFSKATDYYGGRVALNAEQLQSGYHFLPDFMYRSDDQGKVPVPVYRS